MNFKEAMAESEKAENFEKIIEYAEADRHGYILHGKPEKNGREHYGITLPIDTPLNPKENTQDLLETYHLLSHQTK